MGDLWAVTCYFNPVGYRSRRTNYDVFRRHLTVPLMTVELSFGDGFKLGPQDADILLQVDGGDIMWQKERLLNLAVSGLPLDCEYVAWLDCDIVFGSPQWAEQAKQALNRFSLVHLFNERVDLLQDANPAELDLWHGQKRISIVHKIAMGRATRDDFLRRDAPLTVNSTAGLAWASTREVVGKHGLYDAAILGGGDRLMMCAGVGVLDWGVQVGTFSPSSADHYLAWAHPFYESVKGRVGSVPGRVAHLWHGDLRARRYQDRPEPFRAFDFNPASDISLNASGCWRWSSDKPEMHNYVREYFKSRNEDGLNSAPAPSEPR